jgi:hypothetical protein
MIDASGVGDSRPVGYYLVTSIGHVILEKL